MPASLIRANAGRLLPGVLLYAGAFALAELAAGLLIGQFVARDRAEVGIFLLFRPWLLLLLTLVAIRRPAGERWALYLAAILLASASEALLVVLLGSGNVLGEAARAVLASVALMLLFDMVALGAGRLRGWRGPALAGVAGLGLMAVPGPYAAYERIAAPAEPEAGAKPPLLLLTGLPLMWGEGRIEAALDGSSGPAAAHAALARAYAVRAVDVASPEKLAGAKLLLIAQARPPGPAGLVAIDRWVRDGGRALILSDPSLRWPSEYPLGDPRRPPPYDGLGPLLAHWGLRLDVPAEGRVLVTRDLGPHRLVMAAPGRFVATGCGCKVDDHGLRADCPIGKGRALLFADADLLRDLLWVGPGPSGAERASRLADNAAFVVAQLDRLSGRETGIGGNRVRWIGRGESVATAVLASCIGLGAMLLVGWFLSVRRRRISLEKVSTKVIHSSIPETKEEQ